MPEDRIMERVQKLVDKAFSTTFEAEKESLLAKAEELMMNYSIDQAALLDPSRPNTAAAVKMSTPEVRTVRIYDPGMDQQMSTVMSSMFYNLTDHFQIRKANWQLDCKLVGYPADLDFFEMMFLSLKIHLATSMDPQANPDGPWEDSLIAMKNAGYKWEDIHKRMWNHPKYPFKDMAWERRFGVKFTGLYKKWHDANPDQPRNSGSPKQWRDGFAIGYRDEIRTRLYQMRDAANKANSNLPALMADKKSRLDEFFDDMFPRDEYKATMSSARRGRVARYVEPKLNSAAMGAGRSVARTADLNNPNSRIQRPGTKGLG